MNKLWTKYPSVSTGGKPYFYVAHNLSGKQSVVWNRVENKWGLYDNSDRLIRFFDNDKEKSKWMS